MRHKLISLRWKFMMIISSIFLTLSSTVVIGIPLSKSYSNQENVKNERVAQEKEHSDRKAEDSSCIVNGSKYGKGEHISGAGPCEECICDPPNVTCSMMKCPVNSGCITIQLPNKCCPKYKCDCEHKGKVYYNGEKINESNESACKVCFCNGGEIVCTSIVCYTRNDCQGYYLPGECCPKYDNCSFNPIEQKPKSLNDTKTLRGQNIDYWQHSTEYYDHKDSIWKRDTTETQKEELLTVPNIVTISPLIFDTEISKNINTALPNYFQENNSSKPFSVHETNITYSEISSPQDFSTDTTISNFNINEDLKTLFLDYETGNLTTNNETKDFNLMTQNKTSERIPFEELFDTADVDHSVIITHENGSETIVEGTEVPVAPVIDEFIIPSSGTQVEIFNPEDLITDNEHSMIEQSTTAYKLGTITKVDDGSKEATTLRALDKLKTDPPHKVVQSTQNNLEEEANTENTFTDLEDTTDMFGPNYGPQHQDSQAQVINYKTIFVPTILTTSESLSETTSENTLIKLFDQSSTNTSIKHIENNTSNTSVNTNYNQSNNSVLANRTNNIENNTIYMKSNTDKSTACVNNKSCTGHTQLNDNHSDYQTESPTLTTPFIIETKVLPNQVPPPVSEKKILYPKEYPEEFETIQYGPSLTITKKTYTSIPDIVYTTTTMITLPTLDLIYKADKEIEKYLANQTATTTKPSNNYLSPLQNISSINST